MRALTFPATGGPAPNPGPPPHPTATAVEQRFRGFLLAVSAAALAGTIVELWLGEHTNDPLQFVPFALCGLGLALITVAFLRPRPGTIWALRVTMLVLAAASLLGAYQHFQGNYEFERDIRPNASVREVTTRALHGAAPLLAPGILALAGTLAIAATYAHPALHVTGGGPKERQ